MTGLNLRWWRKRPSVHVADPSLENHHVLFVNPLMFDMLEPSNFLGRFGGLRDITIAGDKRKHFQPGTHVQYEGKHYKVEAVEAKWPDDWFSDELRVTLRDPVAAATEPVFIWDEDEFMPSLAPSA